jgi:predicted PurR-regulated permease PerM
MSKTVRINPLLVFIAVLTGASIGTLIGGIAGGFVAALLAIPTAGALQVLVKEAWQATAPDQPRESPASAAEQADEHGNPAAQHRPHPTVHVGDRLHVA